MKTQSNALDARCKHFSLAAVLLACFGCATEPEEGDSAIGVAHQALTSTDYVDSTGTIRMRVKTCDWTASASSNCAYCSVDEGWARIGGGAEIQGENPGGARIRSSFPDKFSYRVENDNSCTGAAGGPYAGFDDTWVAESTGIDHQLRAYVIGIQMVGDDGAPFKPFVTGAIDRVVGFASAPDTFSVDCSQSVFEESTGFSNLLLVGGGAQILSNTGEAYLIESRPFLEEGQNTWRATALSQGAITDGALKCLAIGMDPCPPEWGGDCITTPTVTSFVSESSFGHNVATLLTEPGLVSTSTGARALSSPGVDRYLADLIPFAGMEPGVTARSKAGLTANSGATEASTIVFGRSGASGGSSILDFDDPTQWTSSAPTSSSTTLKTQGAAGLSVGGGGYRAVTSAPLSTPLANLGSTLQIDVYVPANPPNPYWVGGVQVFAECPSQGLWYEFIGHSDLGGLPLGAFSTLSYPLSNPVLAALGSSATDCRLTVAINSNETAVAPVLDNIRFTP